MVENLVTPGDRNSSVDEVLIVVLTTVGSADEHKVKIDGFSQRMTTLTPK
jgi:hypothetical protein